MMDAATPAAVGNAASKNEDLTGEIIATCFAKALASSSRKKSRYGMPSDETCQFIAGAILRQKKLFEQPRQDTVLGDAQGHAKALLASLPAAFANVQSWYLTAQDNGVPPKDNPHLDGIVIIHAAEESVAALLQKYEREKPRPHSWHELAGVISAWGIHGWRETGRFPKGTNPDGPMCIFVHEVLLALKVSKTLPAISDALSGKRGPLKITKSGGKLKP